MGVINGFYAKMRSEFTVPGQCIYYYQVEWNPSRLSWEDFRGKVLGGTDPKTADAGSLRNDIFKGWKDLDLSDEPNTGNNGVHASASPFEALAERANWLGVPLEEDFYGNDQGMVRRPCGAVRRQAPVVVRPFGGPQPAC